MKDCNTAEEDYQKVKHGREEKWNKSGKVKKREEEVGELKKVVVKVRTQLEIKRGTISEEEKKILSLETELKEVRFYSYSKE